MRARSSPVSERPFDLSEAFPRPVSARPLDASEDLPSPLSTPTPAGGPPLACPPPPPPPRPRPCAAASVCPASTNAHASAMLDKIVQRFLLIAFPPLVNENFDVRGKRGERTNYSRRFERGADVFARPRRKIIETQQGLSPSTGYERKLTDERAPHVQFPFASRARPSSLRYGPPEASAPSLAVGGCRR